VIDLAEAAEERQRFVLRPFRAAGHAAIEVDDDVDLFRRRAAVEQVIDEVVVLIAIPGDQLADAFAGSAGALAPSLPFERRERSGECGYGRNEEQ
jgi:hypothetical protein